MRYVYVRRISNAYQCDPDYVLVPDNEYLVYGDLMRYSLPNGNKKIGYYVCETNETDEEEPELKCVMVSKFKEV